MPDHWGLGMLANAGNGLDDDFSTDVGRIMGTTKVLGFYLSAMYDFANEGKLGAGSGVDRPGYDGSQVQDFDRYGFAVVRRVPDEDEDAVLARGDVLLNGGARFQVSSAGSVLTSANAFKDLRATLYTPDVWAQLRFGKLRLELEAAWIVGSMLNRADNRTTQYVSQLGGALESELRLVNDKLGLYLYAGGATGDSEVEGLSSDANFVDHAGLSGSQSADSSLNNHRVSSFRFHPAYPVAQHHAPDHLRHVCEAGHQLRLRSRQLRPAHRSARRPRVQPSRGTHPDVGQRPESRRRNRRTGLLA
jgi:uncharacterized protein (TIGR04551 family)